MRAKSLYSGMPGFVFHAVLCTLVWIATGARAGGAESSSGSVLEEIVVTAQKREEQLLKAPLAVSAIAGTELEERGYAGLTDFLGVSSNLGVVLNGGITYVTVRGIASQNPLPGADPTVSFHVNGIYMATQEDIGAGFYDVSRVEVLKGPQGTLFGRNAVGGAINVITNLPTDKFEASGDFTAGNYSALSTRLVLSGPVSERLLLRVATATDNHSGYSLNLFDGKHYDDQNAQSARATLIYRASDDLTFTTIADYHREHDGNYAVHYGGIINPDYPLLGVQLGGSTIPIGPDGLRTIPTRLLNDYSLPLNRRESWGISEEIKWDLNENISLSSLSSYRDFADSLGLNFTGSTFEFPSDHPGYNYFKSGETNQISQELQLGGRTDKSYWVLGLYYLEHTVDPGGYTFGLAPVTSPFPFTAAGKLTKRAYAAYGQDTYNLTDRLSLTLGLRYSEETASVDATWTSGGSLLGFFGPCVNLPDQLCHIVDSARFNALTPRIETHYQWTDGLMTYASASRGFKSGGYEITSLAPAFRPATVWTYEVGMKWGSDDQRWATTVAAFHSDYKNMQVQEISQGITAILNAARSKIDGAELELTARPTSALTITNSIGYVDARYVEFTEQNPNYPFLGPPGLLDLSGNQLQYTSKFTNNLRMSYDMPLGQGSLSLSGEWNYRTKEYFSEFNDSREVQPAYSLYSAAARYTSANGHWYMQAYGKNLANSLIISQISIGGCGCNNLQYLPPRTYGITFGYRQ